MSESEQACNRAILTFEGENFLLTEVQKELFKVAFCYGAEWAVDQVQEQVEKVKANG